MNRQPRPLFDPFIIGECRSVDDTSPIEYVRGLLNQRLRVFLIDGFREMLGIFVALDHRQTLVLKDCVEVAEDHEREVGFALIPLVQVQSIELAT
jgi:small nuclear ribonucleoprotein (snRNP)-like protein